MFFPMDWGVPFVFCLWIFYAGVRAHQVVQEAERKLESERLALDAIAAKRGSLLGDSKLPRNVQETEAFGLLRAARRDGVWGDDALPYASWIQRARYIAGIFVFIGLGGTVLGIALSLSSLGSLAGNGSEATADQLKSVLNSVGAILSGMKTASICTGVGILATLWQSYENNKYLMSAATISEKADRVWRDTVRQEFVNAEMDHETAEKEQMRAERQRQSEAFDWTQHQLVAQVTERLKESNKELGETFSKAVDEMGAAFGSATGSLDYAVMSLTKQIGGAAQQLFDTSQTAGRVTETLESVRVRLEGAATALTDTMAAGYEQLGQIQNLVGESAQTITVGHEQLTLVAARLGSAVESLGDDRAASLNALTQDRTQTLEGLRRDREEMLETLAADRENLLARLQTTVSAMETDRAFTLAALSDGVRTSLEAAATERKSLADTLKKSLAAATAEREVLERMTRDEVQRAQEAATRADGNAIRLFESVMTNHETQQVRSDALLTGVRATEERLTALLARFEKTLTEVAALSDQAQLRASVVEVAARLDQTQQAAHAGVTALGAAAEAAQNVATAQRLAQDRIGADAQGWREARDLLQALTKETTRLTERVVATSEQAMGQTVQIARQQAEERAALFGVFRRIEIALPNLGATTGNEAATGRA